MQLCDSWRLLYPQGRDYTFYSHPHDMYSRIDYILLQHPMLNLLVDTSIGNILHSDHAPVHCDLHLPNTPNRSFTWRLNETLLSDSLCLSELKKAAKDFAEIHATDHSTAPIKWEALKCVLRGVLIKHGSRLDQAPKPSW